MEIILYCGAYLLLFAVNDGAVTSPPDQEACVGDNVLIPWLYDDTSVGSVIWSVNSSTDIMTYFSGGSRNPVGGYNVIDANDNGSITLISATRSNTGTYQIVVSAGVTSSDQVEVLVCEPLDTSGLKGTKSGSEWKCEASNLGDPEANLYIKVNGENKTSSSAEVTSSDRVECCLYGCAVNCSESATYEYCKIVQRPRLPCPPWKIVLIVIVILYFVGVLIGIIKCLLQSKKLCECCGEKLCDWLGKGNELNWWVVIPLCVIIVGLGIITVWLICRLCSSGEAENPGDSEGNKESKEMDGQVTNG